MSLFKHVNGKRVEMTAEEEQVIRNEWAANAPTVESVRAKKIKQAQQAYIEVMQPISDAFPAVEREGWGEQTRASNNVKGGQSDKLIDALRRKTGQTAQELADEIAAKRDEYQAVYGQHTGTLRGLRKQIKEATTLAELDAIDIQGAFTV